MTVLTRRNIASAASAAVLIAASKPAAALLLSGQPDAALLGLREPFERTWQAYKTALATHSVAEATAWRRHRAEPHIDPKQIDRQEGLPASDALVDKTECANRQIIERMCVIPARTIECLAFKAKVSLEHEDNRFEELVTSIMDDILAMAGGAHA